MGVELAGRPIAITGASSGIGRATALACAQAGMPVALGARRVDRLEELAGQIRRAGGVAVAIELDVTSDALSSAFIERAEQALGPLHAVFANAGIGMERPFHRTSDQQLREIFEVNLFGTTRVLRPALDRFIQRGRGHAIICSSSLARLPIPRLGAYGATKAAQWHLGRAMRCELKPLGVQVSTVHPIGTRTAFFEQAARRSESPSLSQNTPRAFMQAPERVARAVLACLRRPRAEVWTSTTARLALGLLSTFPALSEPVLDRLARRLARQGASQAAPQAAARDDTPPGNG